MAEPDPAARIAAVRQYVLTARTAIASAADAVSGALASALGWLPAPTIAAVSGRLTSTNDVQVSNVPGVPDPVYVAGSRITHMYPFGPLPGCAPWRARRRPEGGSGRGDRAGPMTAIRRFGTRSGVDHL
jgi:hypothetical protein